MPPTTKVRAICAGLGGVVSAADKKGVCDILASTPFADKNTHTQAHNDMVVGESGGNSGRDGMVLIMGTGCVVYGRMNGKEHKSGGWGWKEGDFGSCFALGSAAIQALTAAYDGREEVTPFTEALFKHFKLKEIADITTVLYQQDLSRADIAKLAPFVTEYADKGDKTAQAIAKKCAEDVFKMLRAVHSRIAQKPDQEIECCLIGSLANLKGFIRDTIEKMLTQNKLRIKLHPPELDAEVGAALLAYGAVNK